MTLHLHANAHAIEWRSVLCLLLDPREQKGEGGEDQHHPKDGCKDGSEDGFEHDGVVAVALAESGMSLWYGFMIWCGYIVAYIVYRLYR